MIFNVIVIHEFSELIFIVNFFFKYLMFIKWTIGYLTFNIKVSLNLCSGELEKMSLYSNYFTSKISLFNDKDFTLKPHALYYL